MRLGGVVHPRFNLSTVRNHGSSTLANLSPTVVFPSDLFLVTFAIRVYSVRIYSYALIVSRHLDQPCYQPLYCHGFMSLCHVFHSIALFDAADWMFLSFGAVFSRSS